MSNLAEFMEKFENAEVRLAIAVIDGKAQLVYKGLSNDLANLSCICILAVALDSGVKEEQIPLLAEEIKVKLPGIYETMKGVLF